MFSVWTSCLVLLAFDFSVCLDFSAMSIKLPKLILHIAFGTKASDFLQRRVRGGAW